MNKDDCLTFLLINCKNRYLFSDTGFRKKFPEFYNELITWVFPEDFKFNQKLYHYLNDDPELKLGICPVCKNRCTFCSLGQGYSRCCSRKCSFLDKQRSEKIASKLTNKSEEEKQKIKEKREKTCLEKYGESSYMKTDSFRNKLKYFCLNKYNCENPSQANEIKEKKKQTCLNRYNCENPFQSEEIKEKIKETNLDRYCKEYYSQTDDYKEKTKQTCLNRYNCENPSQANEIKEKIKETCLERYGTEYAIQSEEIKEKAKETCLQKYGTESYSQTDEFKNKFKDTEWVKLIQEKSYKTKKKNKSFHTSKIEKHLKQYLDKLGVNYEYQYTSELYPFACDFYFPDKDLYVEIQGSWTHGPHPFTGSEEDLKLLEKWKSKNTKYYQNAINTWTVRDVNKREIAKKHNLNYLEIFSIDLETCINFIYNL